MLSSENIMIEYDVSKIKFPSLMVSFLKGKVTLYAICDVLGMPMNLQSRATVVPMCRLHFGDICHVLALCITAIYIYTIASCWNCWEKTLLEEQLMDNLSCLAETLVFSDTLININVPGEWAKGCGQK